MFYESHLLHVLIFFVVSVAAQVCSGASDQSSVPGGIAPMIRRRRVKCRHCGQLLRPDPRNLRHQRYCSAQPCRGASKAASQRRWLAKAENRDYFCGPEHVARVRAGRAAHPGYGRKKSSRRRTSQEHSSTQPVDINTQSGALDAPALQEVSLAQTLVLTGLIAHLTGAALQEDIALTSRRLQQWALDIVHGDPDGRETIAPPPPPAPHPRPVQPARPPLG